jgi:hypothetical protein
MVGRGKGLSTCGHCKKGSQHYNMNYKQWRNGYHEGGIVGKSRLFFTISAMPARLPIRVGLGRTGVPGTRLLVRVNKIRSRTLLWLQRTQWSQLWSPVDLKKTRTPTPRYLAIRNEASVPVNNSHPGLANTVNPVAIHRRLRFVRL